MVLLAASICTRDGKALLSRQFVEMTKSRIEGLIATFPKLVGEGKQHTFVETESVRYVYQPLEKLYVLLITTKASNILEDLETLRLFARVIPEYAHGTTEADILGNAFELIFAFDEIVALGYREDVNLSQIRTFTKMDSIEERAFRALQESKEREAKEIMKQRARDLQLARQEAAKRGLSGHVPLRSTGGYGSDSYKPDEPYVVSSRDRFGSMDDHPTANITPAVNFAPVVKHGGMKLSGGQSGKVENFVDRLKAEGVTVRDDELMNLLESDSGKVERGDRGKRGVVEAVKKEDLHLRIEEKLIVQARRDGGLDQFELQGIMNALASSAVASEARVRVDTSAALNPPNEQQPPAQLQTHPNLDKKAFTSSHWLQVKPGGKPFPQGQEVGVLRWRFQTTEESVLPITINCWPNEIRGGFEVNIEYELQNTALELHDVCLTIPLPSGSKPPAVGTCDGEYAINSQRTQLRWTVPIVDASNSTGSLEFTLGTNKGASADQFFPITLEMHAANSLCGIKIVEVTDAQQNPLPFSVETNLRAERYEIV